MKKQLLCIILAGMLIISCGCEEEVLPPITVPAMPSETTQPTETEPTPTETEPTPTETEPAPTETEPLDIVTLLDFLKIAVAPVGNTMYVWGGGWNEADTGAGEEAVTLGVSPNWAEFAEKQTADYDFDKTRYQIHDGLDCSGYVGWAVYNAMETENGQEGYVYPSTKMAQEFANRGLGVYIPSEEITQWLPGDIMSMKGHVWIVVGMCDDGSVLFLHASPPGVMFSGTLLADGSDSQATQLAQEIMSKHYPKWHSRYPDYARPYAYLTASSAMRWQETVLPDPEGITQMPAHEVINLLFPSES